MERYQAAERRHQQAHLNGDRDVACRGARFRPDPTSTVTINPTDDPAAPGGFYVSYAEENDHSTSVYHPDGTLADVKANREWVEVDRQD